MATVFRSMNQTLYRAFRIIGDARPDSWIVREGMRYHLTPALCGRNRWRVEYSLIPVYDGRPDAYAVGLTFTVKGQRAKSRAWRARRLARVQAVAKTLPVKEK